MPEPIILTPSNPINYSKLYIELKALSFGNKIDGCNLLHNGNTEIVINTELDNPLETTILNDAVNNHNNSQLIYQLNNLKQINPDQPYNVLGLFKQEIISDITGYIETVNYWVNYDFITAIYSNLAVMENRSYTEDGSENMFPIRRDMVINWYYQNSLDSNDFTEHESYIGQTKTVIKQYSFTDMRDSSKRRRENLVKKAENYALMVLQQEDAVDLLNALNINKLKYIDGIVDPLITQIQTIIKLYLTQEIRDNLISYLDYWTPQAP